MGVWRWKLPVQRVFRMGFPEKMTFEKRLKGRKRSTPHKCTYG